LVLNSSSELLLDVFATIFLDSEELELKVSRNSSRIGRG